MTKKQVQKLISAGFDKTRSDRVRCSLCEALVIQNTATHEHGCPNQKKLRESGE